MDAKQLKTQICTICGKPTGSYVSSLEFSDAICPICNNLPESPGRRRVLAPEEVREQRRTDRQERLEILAQIRELHLRGLEIEVITERGFDPDLISLALNDYACRNCGSNKVDILEIGGRCNSGNIQGDGYITSVSLGDFDADDIEVRCQECSRDITYEYIEW